jgi:hypothetical protein
MVLVVGILTMGSNGPVIFLSLKYMEKKYLTVPACAISEASQEKPACEISFSVLNDYPVKSLALH